MGGAARHKGFVLSPGLVTTYYPRSLARGGAADCGCRKAQAHEHGPWDARRLCIYGFNIYWLSWTVHTRDAGTFRLVSWEAAAEPRTPDKPLIPWGRGRDSERGRGPRLVLCVWLVTRRTVAAVPSFWDAPAWSTRWWASCTCSSPLPTRHTHTHTHTHARSHTVTHRGKQARDEVHTYIQTGALTIAESRFRPGGGGGRFRV